MLIYNSYPTEFSDKPHMTNSSPGNDLQKNLP